MQITGAPESVSRAIESSYYILDSHRGIKSNYRRGYHRKLKLSSAVVQVKFLFPNFMIGYIIGKHGRFTKKLQEQYDCLMRFERSPKVYFVDYKKTDMCIINGRMDNIQDALCYIL